MSFASLGLAPGILKAVAETGYTAPTPIQAAAIPHILTGRDVTGIAQTGTGKTAAFTLPILTRMAAADEWKGTRTLVLAPTRELAAQIIDNVREYGKHLPVRSAAVFGGVGEKPQIDALRAGTSFVVACPGRLLDLMNRGCADFSGLRHLVLDEADRMLDMGFLPDIRRIVAKLPRERQTLLFSATLSPEIEKLSHDFQRNPQHVEIGRRSNPAATVTQWACDVAKAHKPALLSALLADEAMRMVLVFTRTKHGADRVCRQLERQGIRCAALHANRSQNQRLRALADFRDGKVRVLVATDIAARGIDVDGITHVVNFDFPGQFEDYVHRIGRTGRAEAVGTAISFLTSEDRDTVRALERATGRPLARMTPPGFDAATLPPAPAEERRPPAGGGRGGRAPQPPRRQQAPRSQGRPQESGRPRHESGGSRQEARPRPAARESDVPQTTEAAASASLRARRGGRRGRRW